MSARPGPPDEAEARFVAAGIASAVTPPGIPRTHLQDLLLRAIALSMTGIDFDPAGAPHVSAAEFAAGMDDHGRNLVFRTRVMQLAVLAALVEHPVCQAVVKSVAGYSSALGVDDGSMLQVACGLAKGSEALVGLDFMRSGYGAELPAEVTDHMHVARVLDGEWAVVDDDPELAARWAALEHCPEGSIGLGVWRFYAARGFRYPGEPGSAPPFLAQHDWVHVLADFGSTVESEIEVFGFIARATDQLDKFTLLAMVIGLFETGDIAHGAGLFDADPGHLSRTEGMATRLADALRRGALTCGDQRFMEMDWFAVADRQVAELREEWGVLPKSPACRGFGSVGPFDPQGMSPYQFAAGQALAAERGRAHETWGATPFEALVS